LDKNQGDHAALTQIIIQLIEEKKPENVHQLINFLRDKTALPEQKIMEHILCARAYVLGTIFVLWLPGYSFTKALFPADPLLELSPKVSTQ